MAAIEVLLLISFIFPSQSELYSLYYTYSATSKYPISEEMYEFYSSIELSGIQMNFCNSVNKADFLKQLCEESESLFTNENDDVNYKQEFKINLIALMDERKDNRINDTDLRVLQWRHGCAVERHSNGSIIFLQGTDEYAYDGETFDHSMHWKPLVLEHDTIWSRESVSNLERKCVETLTSFTDLQQGGKFITASRPEVYSSVKVSGSSEQQVLVCLATGFYPKHVQMEIRHDQKALPDEQLNSSGIRPNADGSFQLKKSLKILLSDRSHYQCVVKHQTLTEPLIISWDEVNVLLPVIIGVVVALVVLAIIVLCWLRKYVEYRKSLKTLSQSQSVGESDEQFGRTQMEPKPLEEIRLDTHSALNAASDDENAADDSMEEVQSEELHETQSLCEAKEAPAAAPPAAAQAIEGEDTNQHTVTQNALLSPLPTLDENDSDESS